MDIDLSSQEFHDKACRKARLAVLFVSALFVLTFAARDPLSAKFSDRQDAAPMQHPNAGYSLEFGGLRG